MTTSRDGSSGFRTWHRHDFLLIFKRYRKRLNAASYLINKGDLSPVKRDW
jgi:hypothetical protein